MPITRPIEKIWGIEGSGQIGRHAQHDMMPETPGTPIWQELNGQHVLKLDTKEKDSYASIGFPISNPLKNS